MSRVITAQTQFDSMVSAYRNRSKTLFTPDGQQRRGSTIAVHFWAGFNGGARPVYVPASDPCYKAGQYCRTDESPTTTHTLGE